VLASSIAQPNFEITQLNSEFHSQFPDHTTMFTDTKNGFCNWSRAISGPETRMVALNVQHYATTSPAN
jgi:hypothetical protein